MVVFFEIEKHLVQVEHGKRQTVIVACSITHLLRGDLAHHHAIVDVGFEIAKGFRMTLIFGWQLPVGKFDDTHRVLLSSLSAFPRRSARVRLFLDRLAQRCRPRAVISSAGHNHVVVAPLTTLNAWHGENEPTVWPQFVNPGKLMAVYVRAMTSPVLGQQPKSSENLSVAPASMAMRLSDLEPRFICTVCGTRGADVRPDFGWGTHH
jgi:hypothetical protein